MLFMEVKSKNNIGDKMKKSELRKIIREEAKKILSESSATLNHPLSGKDVAAEMKKDKLLKSWASKVEKMKTITYLELDKMLPDSYPGASLIKIFKNLGIKI